MDTGATKPPFPENAVHITRLELGLMRVRSEDAQNEYRLIPVWDVIGYEDVDRITGVANPDPQNHIETLLTLNAVDGSTVDRDMGF